MRTYLRRAGVGALLVACMLWLPAARAQATLFVRAGAAGNGTSWTNACGDITGACALVRGNTYYVAGSGASHYSSISSLPAISGTTLITIKGATAADHGNGAGWTNSMSVSTADGGSAARWANTGGSVVNLNTSTGYLTMDGNVVTDVTNAATYGFFFEGSGQLVNIAGVQHMTFSHIAAHGPNPGGGRFASTGGGGFVTHDITFSYDYFDFGDGGWEEDNAFNLLYDHLFTFGQEFVGGDKEVLNNNCTDGVIANCGPNTVRYSYFGYTDLNDAGQYTGCIIGKGAGAGSIAVMNPWFIYGNIFNACQGNSGTIFGINGNDIANTMIFNNTFANIQGILYGCDSPANCSGNFFEDNIVWNGSALFYQAPITHDYNTYIGTTSTPTGETHGKVLASGNPFVASNNGAIGTPEGDWHITAAGNSLLAVGCTPGTAGCIPSGAIGQTYSTDLDGVTRGGVNGWTPGAYQFVSAAQTQFYVRPGAGPFGTGSGNNWTNACAGFTGTCLPSALSRGATYYVAAGSYPAVTFSTPDSGTQIITIQGATAANAGTVTGWSGTFAVGTAGQQAVFGNVTNAGQNQSITTSTDFWVIDGSVPNSAAPTNVASAFGFATSSPGGACGSTNIAAVELSSGSGGGNHIRVSNVAAVNPCTGLAGASACFLAFDAGGAGITDITFSYNYSSNWIRNWQFTTVTTALVEHNWAENQQTSGCHGESMAIVGPASGIVVRYNMIKNCRGTACIASLGGTDGTTVQADVYGNVFVDALNSGQGAGTPGGDGVVAGGGSTNCFINTHVYNNTVFNSFANFFAPYQNASTCAGLASTSFAQNNLVYNGWCTVSGDLSNAVTSPTGSAITQDWNTCLLGVQNNWTGTHLQTGTFNPFTNSAADNYTLTQDAGTGANQVNVGNPLVSPYTLDLTGAARGGDGSWERGAYEFTLNAPNITCAPASINFGNQNTGTTSASQAITCTNGGSQSATISSCAITGTNNTQFAITDPANCPATLSNVAGSNSLTQHVTFSPTTTGAKSANYTVTYGTPTASTTLAGTGVASAPTFSLSPASVQCGSSNLNIQVTCPTITVTNTGTASATISTKVVSPSTHFAETDTCGATLAVNQSCTVTPTFKPTIAGALAATFTITDTPDSISGSATLNGTGVNPNQISLLRVTNCGPQSFSGSCTIPATGAGNLLVVGFQWQFANAAVGAINSMSDNVGDAIAQARVARCTLAPLTNFTDIWWGVTSGGATTVTINTSIIGTAGVVIWEFTGGSLNAQDQGNSLVQTNQNPFGASVTTLASAEAVVSILQPQSAVSGIFAGNAFVSDSSLLGNGWAHLITAASGAYQAQWATAASAQSCASTASFSNQPAGIASPGGLSVSGALSNGLISH